MKTCPYCAEEVQDEAIKCRWCGSDLTAPAPAAPGTQAQPTTTAARGGPAGLLASTAASFSSWRAVRHSWGPPLLAALGALLCILVFSFVILLGVSLLAGGGQAEDREANGDAAVLWSLTAWSSFILQRVPVMAGAAGEDVLSVRIAFAPLGALLVVGVVLAFAGSWAASRETALAERLSAVLRFGVLFALVSFAVSFLADFTVDVVEAGPSHVSAFLLPLAWALLFGAVGMARSAYGRSWWHRLGLGLDHRLRGAGPAMDGALSGARAGLGLALIAVLILYIYRATTVAPGTGTRLIWGWVVGALLLLPNLVGFAILGGMGATLRLSGNAGVLAASASAGIFGSAGLAVGRVRVPPYFLLLMLIPLAGMVRAGFVAARRSPDQRIAVRAALLAGAPLAVACWLLAWLSGGQASLHQAEGTVNASASVSPIAAIFLPLLWALVGTSIGAVLCLARQQQRHRHAQRTTAATTGTADPSADADGDPGPDPPDLADAGPPPSGGTARHRRAWNLGFLALVVLMAGAALGTALLRANRPAAPKPPASGSPSGTGESRTPTPTPAGTTRSPGGPRIAGAVDYTDATDSRAPDVAGTLDEYFAGINTKNYQRTSAVLDPRSPLTNPETWTSFVNGVSTTTDSDIVLHDVSTGSEPGTVTAHVTFRSSQAPGFGPAGHEDETCTRWSITFTLSESTPNRFLVVNSRGSDSRC